MLYQSNEKTAETSHKIIFFAQKVTLAKENIKLIKNARQNHNCANLLTNVFHLLSELFCFQVFTSRIF